MPDYPIQAFLAMGAATFATRLFPFLIPRRYRHDARLRYAGENLPPAIMLLLVIYCLKDVRFASAPHGAPELIAVALVAGLQVWKRNSLISIGIGTACYMYLVRRL